MQNVFDLVEPLPPSELIANYWHFLKSIDGKDRKNLGPVELVLKSRTVARGWPIGLKNQTLALISEVDLSPKSSITFIDVSEVSSVSFFGAHLVLPFATAGAVARSPLEKRTTLPEAKQNLVRVCEELRKLWPARIYFDSDPTQGPLDEIINLNSVLESVVLAVREVQKDDSVRSDLDDCKSFHVLNAVDMKDIALTKKDTGEIELAFKFSRALPKNLDDTILTLLTSAL